MSQGPGFTVRCIVSVPKRAGEINEDSVAVSRRHGRCALSDGASISYDSAAWSRILVRRFARRPELTPLWLSEAIEEFSALHNREELPWMKQAAFDRGSFASLLGVRYRPGSHVQIIGIGDSLAALCDGQELVETFPYTEPSQFDASPELLSTNPTNNAFFREVDAAYQFSTTWSLEGLKSPAVLCMTDALGRWLLQHQDERPTPVSRLLGIRNRRTFARFVEAERRAERLKRDDTTLVTLW